MEKQQIRVYERTRIELRPGLSIRRCVLSMYKESVSNEKRPRAHAPVGPPGWNWDTRRKYSILYSEKRLEVSLICASCRCTAQTQVNQTFQSQSCHWHSTGCYMSASRVVPRYTADHTSRID